MCVRKQLGNILFVLIGIENKQRMILFCIYLQLDRDISAYTYEKTLAMEQRSAMLNMIRKQRSGPSSQQQQQQQQSRNIPVPYHIVFTLKTF